MGSSPRMRGKQGQQLRQAALSRLIPAHAGKTARSLLPYLFRWAHPRACGENDFPQDAVGLFPGSSPRMRGKLIANFVRTGLGGLIPAHAEKTSWVRR